LLEEKDHIEFPSQKVTMIKEAAETILQIIDGVLAGLDIGNYEHEEHKKKRFGNIVEQLKCLFYPPAKAKGLSLTFVNQVDSGLRISHSFSLKLLQITSNLLSNAVKFTPQNGAVEVTITQDTDENKNILRITVTDNGQGMTADQIAAFNNGVPVARSTGTNGEQSFGIGLVYVKQVVTQKGGTISVNTTTNKGTQFLCSLPIPVDHFSKLLSSLQENITKQTSNGIK
jgi:signal transduction histidine kinase